MGESGSFEAAAKEDNAVDLNSETCVAFPRAIARALGLQGPVRAYGTACAAGNYAIGAAAQQLRKGHIDLALAGGVEPFSRIAMTGFSRSRAMSEGTCRPFDQQRDGMLLGEGAAILVLERSSDAAARGMRPLAIVGALGLTCDAYHPTSPDPDGVGAAAAFRRAFATQGLEAGDIDWVCAHGTGTLLSDAAEAKALDTVFAKGAPPVSGIKGALGHSMGAATAIEAAICALAIDRQQLPPTIGLEEPAFDLPFVRAPLSQPVRWAANAGFAFGGLNAVLLLGAP
jgi:3-oxoacyl-[acyl-carrier-protein] synthase II